MKPIDPEWRLYGRSAADDKGGVMAILSAFDALIASGVKPTSNLKFLGSVLVISGVA
jgi:acetylornithine deacetylase/succinyl-diaminopimelate desuccinylase-like protein